MPETLVRERTGRLTTTELLARRQWIEDFNKLNFISPTYGEMGIGWGGISKSAVSETIEGMIMRGWLVKYGKSPRSIRLVRGGDHELPTTQERD